MKKNLFTAAAVLLFAVSLVSCKKETPVPVSESSGSAPSPISFSAKESLERTPVSLPLEKYSWKVGNININGVNLTPSYCEYGFKFNPDNSVVATREFAVFNGAWSVNNSNSFMSMLFDPNEKVSLLDLNGNWKIARITSRSVFLQIDDMAYHAELRFDQDIIGIK